jgi:hypothetical protein
MLPKTRELASIAPRNVRPFLIGAADVADVFPELGKLGISGITPSQVRRMLAGVAMDDLQVSVTPATIATPIQFLQNWLPGFVNVITQARKIDELIGIVTAGAWEDEEIVQGMLEQLGTTVPYGDYTNVPLASWNPSWERRTVIRFEEGMRAGVLEEARAARINVNSQAQKREAATLALEISRNRVGFFGFNAGNNRTYGFLNDPNLPAATVFPNGASGFPQWSTKTMLEIIKDIRAMVVALRSQSGDTVDPEKTPLTLAIASNCVDFLTVISDFGMSVRKWMTDTYPKMRVVSAPELNLAISGDNAAYLYAESIDDTSTDDKRVWVQVVPAKFRLIGTQQMAKGYEEDYSNATAGVMLKRPFAVVRRYGC